MKTLRLAIPISALAIAALAVPMPTQAATKHKRAHHVPQTYAAQQQIACTQVGCLPVPRGCYPAPGRTFSGLPSAFDVMVCPGGRTLYGIR